MLLNTKFSMLNLQSYLQTSHEKINYFIRKHAHNIASKSFLINALVKVTSPEFAQLGNHYMPIVFK